MRSFSRGFTLVEAMIVVTVIGILAAVGFPTLLSYHARAQVSEATGLLWAAKTPLAEYFNDNGAWPGDIAQVVGTTTGRYTASMAYQVPPDDAGSLTLVATMKSFGISPEIRNGTVLLRTTDGGASWTCSAGGARPLRTALLPGACR